MSRRPALLEGPLVPAALALVVAALPAAAVQSTRSGPAGTPAPRTRVRVPDELSLSATLAPDATVHVGQLLVFELVAEAPPGRRVTVTMPAPPPGLVLEPVVDGGPIVRRQVRWYVARDFAGERTLVFEAHDDGTPAERVRLELPVHVAGTTGFNTRTVEGDVTGDGVPDLVAAAFAADVGGAVDAGAVYVWAGGAAPSETPDAVLRVPGAGAGAQLARTFLRLAELTGDGVLDVVACAPEANVGGVSRAGAVYVWRGGGHLATRGGEAVAPLATLAETNVGPDLLFGEGVSQSIYLRDVDGDGQADVLVVAPLADRPGAKDAGVACLWLGGPALQGQPAPSASLMVPDAVAGDQLGFGREIASVSGQGQQVSPGFAGSDGVLFGDVTGDGRTDVVVSASLADGDAPDVGKLYVFRAGVALSGPQQPTATLVVAGAAADDRLGVGSLTRLGQGFRLADLTGDGVLDVLAVAEQADVGGVADAGAAYVWAGGPTLAGEVPALATLRSGAPGAGAFLGSTAAHELLDVTGDGLPDVVLGTSRLPRAGSGNVGEAYVFAGGPGLAGTVLPAATLVPTSGAPNTFFSLGGFDTSSSGYPFAGLLLADVTGDGVADVLGCARGAEVDGVTAAGAVYLWHGGAALTGTLGPHATLRRASPLFGDQVGRNDLRAFDLTGDGVLDVVALSSTIGIGGLINQGAVIVWTGGAGLAGDVSQTAVLRIDSTTDFQYVGLGHLAFGPTLRFADVTGDGVADVLVGASRASVTGTETGAVFVWAGGGTLAGRLSPTAELVPSDPFSQLTHAAWGHPFRLADVTGDGVLDVLVQDITRRVGSAPFAGSVDVWAGGSGLAGRPLPLVSLVSAAPTSGHRLGQAAGNAVHLADVTGDGLLDLLVGAEEADAPLDAGEVLLFRGPVTAATAPERLHVAGAQPDDGLGD